MDYLWNPWRYRYISKENPPQGCIFCTKPAEHRDAENLIVWRAQHNFVILNLFPYTTGHLMVVPYEHSATLTAAPATVLTEMMSLTAAAEKHLVSIYKAPGLNIGMNVGACAGAGVAGHIHMHVVPRWAGDSNFMTPIGETRILPEDLTATYEKVKAEFDRNPHP